jgi:hypothetical protein
MGPRHDQTGWEFAKHASNYRPDQYLFVCRWPVWGIIATFDDVAEATGHRGTHAGTTEPSVPGSAPALMV